MSEIGKQASSEELAEKISDLGVSGKSDITFIIGGAFGLSPELLKVAKEIIFLQDDIYSPNDTVAISRADISGI